MEGGPRWMLILGGILGIAIGLLTINRPDVTAVALVLLIGVWSIATGITEVVAAYNFRQVLENEWLLVISGVISLAFGVLLIVAPGTGIFAVLYLIGYYAIFAGIVYIGMGLRLRSVHEKLQSFEKVADTVASAVAQSRGGSSGQNPTAPAGS
jgi:uncharacterized membrane protein HdeD (DUF308 family)